MVACPSQHPLAWPADAAAIADTNETCGWRVPGERPTGECDYGAAEELYCLCCGLFGMLEDYNFSFRRPLLLSGP